MLIETVARALCESTEEDVFDELPVGSIHRAVHLQRAKAAIIATLKAVREPSEAALQAGMDIVEDAQDDDWLSIEDIWRAMIDAQLTELEQSND